MLDGVVGAAAIKPLACEHLQDCRQVVDGRHLVRVVLWHLGSSQQEVTGIGSHVMRRLGVACEVLLDERGKVAIPVG